MTRTVPAVLTTAILAAAAVTTASTPARWALLAAATLVFHFAYLLFVMLGALLGLRDVRWLAVHLPGVVWGIVGLVMTKRCPVTLLEKLLWEKAGRTPYDGTFLQHYVFGMILPESSQGLVYWAQAGLVVGAYFLAIRRHLRGRRARLNRVAIETALLALVTENGSAFKPGPSRVASPARDPLLT